jgi:hypothetical protein
VQDTPDTQPAPSERRGSRGLIPRIPSARVSAALAVVMLAVGIAVGAAIGPAPEASLAGGASGVARELPQLVAALDAGLPSATSASTPTASVQPPAVTPQPTPAAGVSSPATAASPSPASKTNEGAGEEAGSSSPPSAGKLPAVSNVWLLELSGNSFAEALAHPDIAPYITGTLLPASTLLTGWSSQAAVAFAGEATLAQPPAPGATPPLLHSIVQPPCPEGAAGEACAPGSSGALTAADEFLRATLATITSTPAYREHGLVVVTFTTVGIAAQAGLPAAASSATLTYEPPAGVALLSPFARAGARRSSSFNPTSPRRSLEALLH